MADRIKRRLILLVDDDVVLRNLVRHTLEIAGFQVMAAAHGGEALELSRTYPEHIDVLVTDIDMPEMDGISLAEHVRRERPDTRVLVISGGTEAASIQKLELPFVPKPFLPEFLIEEIKKLIASMPNPHDRNEK
jgi:two-component system, cell cycle sensor histidine kinase and response regulator CckA